MPRFMERGTKNASCIEGEAPSTRSKSTRHLSDGDENQTAIGTALCCPSNVSSQSNTRNVPSTVRRVKRKKCLCVCVCVGLWRSKEHRKLIFRENSFPTVFGHGEHGFECEQIWDHFKGGHVTPLCFRGQKNIEICFFTKTLIVGFSARRT